MFVQFKLVISKDCIIIIESTIKINYALNWSHFNIGDNHKEKSPLYENL